ncbi:hypothetical protein SAMN02983003_0416 [Devosia enhydra]|uniref:Porin n=1 Tax=Devosia enhydra TaxID=665118 RepID=A0A1K2HT77_9HYPH|nr:hypothetical protein [Devosia enhydra]SFZ81287.1 hypothetical protein SAMN02983003_0416 [Devosia enhydra]
MKIRSLLLGSVAAAGLSTGAFAADLGVLTSLDVCDALGISGLTLSSDSNCLSITGGVSYEFTWGDYGGDTTVYFGNIGRGNTNVITGGSRYLGDDGPDFDEDADLGLDWDNRVEAWLKLTAAAASDFGTAKAIIGFRQYQHTRVRNEVTVFDPNDSYEGWRAGPQDFEGSLGWGDNLPLELDEAYVSIGDSTVIMAGLRRHGINGSIANVDDDAAFTLVQPFHSSTVTGSGVLIEGGKDDLRFGGAAIQVVSDLGNGFSVGAALENIDNSQYAVAPSMTASNNAANAGTLLGVINYKGDGVTAHVTGGAFGVLDADVNNYFVHAGATGTFDNFRVRGAFGYESDLASTGADDAVWNALVSAEATFDIFKLAAAFDYADGDAVDEQYGVALSAAFTVTDTVGINLLGRWAHNENVVAAEADTYHVAAQLVASVTESIKLTGEVGGYFNDGGFAVTGQADTDSIYYGSLEAAWAPGGGYTASIKGEVNSVEAYRATFKAAKSFQ